MTGGAKAADAGTLTLMVGGSPAVVEACRPLLGPIAGKVFHVGETGTGHAMKLIHNMICHTIFLATSEGCLLAERLGIPLETAIAVINAGNARSFVSEQRFPNHMLRAPSTAARERPTSPRIWRWPRICSASRDSPAPIVRSQPICWSGRCSRGSASRTSRRSIATSTSFCRPMAQKNACAPRQNTRDLRVRLPDPHAIRFLIHEQVATCP